MLLAVKPARTRLREGDGRHARSERTKQAVADALLALIEEGDLRPTAQRIAERAGVSLRIVFHHFADLNEIFTLVAQRQMARVLPTLHPIAPEGPVEERLRRFALQRSRLLERIAPIRRAATLVEPFSPVVGELLREVRALKRQAVANVFAPELDALDVSERVDLTAALGAAASFESWEALRTHQRLSLPDARRVLARTVAALLRVPPDRILWDALHDGEIV